MLGLCRNLERQTLKKKKKGAYVIFGGAERTTREGPEIAEDWCKNLNEALLIMVSIKRTKQFWYFV